MRTKFTTFLLTFVFSFSISMSLAQTGNLRVNVRNVSSGSSSLPGNDGVVVLYDKNYKFIKDDQTNSSAQAYFSGIAAGTGHNIEAYHEGGTIFGDEFWGAKGGITISSGTTTTTSITRNMPYATDVTLKVGGKSVALGSDIVLGSTVTISVKIVNPNSSSKTARARLVLDRNKSSSYDYDNTASAGSISSSRIFSFTYKPSRAGAYYHLVGTQTYVNSKYTTTDGTKWNSKKLFNIIPDEGDLDVTVYNVSGGSSSLPGTNGDVKLYDKNWKFVDSDGTNSSAKSSFHDIASGTNYNIEAYHEGGTIFGDEYWASKGGITISAGKKTTTTIRRDMPYSTDVTLEVGGKSVALGSDIPKGKTITIKVKVVNPNSSSITVKPRLVIDRNKTSSYDYDQKASASSVSSSRTFTYTYTPASTGSYYHAVGVESYVNSSYVVTDGTAWTSNKLFSILPDEGKLVTSINNVSGGSSSYPGSDGVVVLYDKNNKQVASKTTNSSAVATFSDIPTGTGYTYEAYHKGGTLFGDEFWGSKSGISIDFNKTTNSSFTRDMPYSTDVTLEVGGKSVALGSDIPLGKSITIKVKVVNPNSTLKSVRPRLILDRNKLSTYDSDQTATAANTSTSRIFTFTYKPSSTGTYYHAVGTETYINSKYTITDGTDWNSNKLFSIVPDEGTLVTTVKNLAGGSTNYPGSNGVVVLYDKNWKQVASKGTNSSGTTTMADIAVGSGYNIESYHKGGTLFGDEFWGSIGNVDIAFQKTTTKTLVRDMPYSTDVAIEVDGKSLPLGSDVPKGKTVKLTVKVVNPNASSQNVRPRLVLDRNKISSYDFDQTATASTVTTSKLFTFTFTPNILGAYYHVIGTETEVNSKFIVTDGADWNSNKFFNVVPDEGTLIATIKNVSNGASSLPGANGVGVLYDDQWNLLGSKATSTSGVATFTGIKTGTNYYLESYHKGGTFFGDEYWGTQSKLDVLLGQTTSTTFTRDMPYSTDVTIEVDGKTVALGSRVELGKTVRVKVKIVNPNSRTQTAYPIVVLDRDKTGSFDHIDSASERSFNSDNEFTIDFTPSATGSFYHIVGTKVKVNSKFLVSDGTSWNSNKLFEIIPAEGSLKLWVHNIDPRSPFPGNDAQVILYNKSYQEIASTKTQDGIATFSNIPKGTDYICEAYHNSISNSTIFGPEYWGSETQIGIETDKTTLDTLHRNMPYFSHLEMYMGTKRVPLGYNVGIGDEITFKGRVKNPVNGYKISSRLRLVLDRDENLAFDFDEYATEASVEAGDSFDFSFTYKTTTLGSFYFSAGTQAKVNNKWIYVDGTAWHNDPVCKVIPAEGTLTVDINNINYDYQKTPGNQCKGYLMNSTGKTVDSVWSKSGKLTFTKASSIPTYSVKVVHFGTASLNGVNQEYWGTLSGIKLEAGKTTNATFTRNSPVLSEYGIEINAIPKLLGSKIELGTKIDVPFTVKNFTGTVTDIDVKFLLLPEGSTKTELELTFVGTDIGGILKNAVDFTPKEAKRYNLGIIVRFKGQGDWEYSEIHLSDEHVFDIFDPNKLHGNRIAATNNMTQVLVNKRQSIDLPLGSTLHQYLLITDSFGNPVKNAQIQFEINGKKLWSTPSSDNGYTDLAVKTYGSDLSNTADDIFGASDVNKEYELTYLTLKTPGIAPDVDVNEFTTITVVPRHFSPLKEEHGAFANAGAEISVCGLCLQAGSAGVSVIEGGVSAGVGGDVKYWFDYDENLNKTHFNTTLRVKGELGANVSLGNVKLETPTKDVSLDAKLAGIGVKVVGFNNVDIRVDMNLKQEEINLWQVKHMLDVFSYVNPHSKSINLLKNIADKRIEGLSLQVSVPKYGTAHGISAEASSGVDMTFGGMKFNLASFSKSGGFLTGNNYYRMGSEKVTEKYVESYGAYSLELGDVGSGMGLEIFRNLKSNSERLDFSNVSFYNVKNRSKQELVQGRILMSNTGLVFAKDGKPLHREISEVVQFEGPALTGIANSTNKNYVGDYLVDKDTRLSFAEKGAANTVRFCNALLEDIKYMNKQGWSPTSWSHSSEALYQNRRNYSIDIPIKIGAGVAGVGAKVNLELGIYTRASYPLSNSYLVPEFDTLAPFVSYAPTTYIESYYDNPAYNQVIEILSNMFNVLKGTTDLTSKSQGVTSGGFTTYTNKSRSAVTQTKQFKKDAFQEFSKISFLIPSDHSAFDPSTDITIDYYFPNGELRGMVDNGTDTAEFILVSDLFFFSAVNGSDTIWESKDSFSVTSKKGADDLRFMGFDTATAVELFHSKLNSDVWTSLGASNRAIKFKETGNFVLGIRLAKDSTDPTITPYDLEQNYRQGDSIFIGLKDSETGIDWRRVSVVLDNQHIQYKRLSNTSDTIIVHLDKNQGDPIESELLVECHDNAGNKKQEFIKLNIAYIGVQNVGVASGISVYPNPVGAKLYIDLQDAELPVEMIQIFDIQGKLVYKQVVDSTVKKHELSLNLPSGTYTLQLEAESRSFYSKKIIIAK